MFFFVAKTIDGYDEDALKKNGLRCH